MVRSKKECQNRQGAEQTDLEEEEEWVDSEEESDKDEEGYTDSDSEVDTEEDDSSWESEEEEEEELQEEIDVEDYRNGQERPVENQMDDYHPNPDEITKEQNNNLINAFF